LSSSIHTTPTGIHQLVSTVLTPARVEYARDAITQWMSRTYELSEETARLRSMEGLRGIAVLLVFFVHFHALFSHYVRHTGVLWEVSNLLGSIGNAGVDLFFVLSGYLIYSALVRHKGTLRRFLARRAVRIYPTFLAVFLFYLGLSVLFPQHSKLHGYEPVALGVYIAQNLLLLPGILPIVPIITVSWSLSYEVAFYLSCAVFIHGTRLWNWAPSARFAVFTGIMIAHLALCFSVHHAHVRALMFLVGILLYEAVSWPGFRSLLTSRGEALAMLAFVLSLAYSYSLDNWPHLFSSLPGWTAGRSVFVGVPGYQGPYKTIALSLTLFWFVGYCFAYKGWLGRLFTFRPLRYLGNMSYSYYLIHGTALQGVALVWTLLWPEQQPSTAAFAFALVVGFAGTWVLSTILFVLVEKRFSLRRPKTTQPLAALRMNA
jgi:exopolysaccharide production protein ExoZ